MRVIAGIWKGRRIRLPGQAQRGGGPRPTTDRVKEALFSILGPVVDGARCVDLCCGAGGLGIEALSRGCGHCDFVDVSARVLAAVSRNLSDCGADPGLYDLHRMDARRFLDRLPDAGPPLLLFADPPYGLALAAEIWHGMTRLAGSGRLLAAVLEHEPGLDLPDPRDGWRRNARRYGNTELSFLEKA